MPDGYPLSRLTPILSDLLASFEIRRIWLDFDFLAHAGHWNFSKLLGKSHQIGSFLRIFGKACSRVMLKIHCNNQFNGNDAYSPPPIWDWFKGIIPGGCGAKEVEGACHRKGRRYRQRRVGAPTPLPQRKQRRRRPKVHRDTRNPSSNLIDNDPDPPSRSSSSLNFWINCQLNRQNRSTRAQKHTHERTPAARRLSDWSSARHVSYGSQDGDHRMQQQYND